MMVFVPFVWHLLLDLFLCFSVSPSLKLIHFLLPFENKRIYLSPPEILQMDTQKDAKYFEVKGDR